MKHFSKAHFLVTILFGVLLFIFSVFSFAADWDSCADDLDRLRRAARDAADVANEVKSKADELENCKRNPEVYDLMGDQCRSKAYEYRSALSNLESELNTVNSRIRSANSSCGFDFSSLGSSTQLKPRPPSYSTNICDWLKSYKKKIPFDTLLKVCIQSMTETECRRCLSR